MANATKTDDSKKAIALTTFDNPYNPIDDFSSWFSFEVEKGYNSCAYLDRIAHTQDALSDNENRAEIERAIDEIIKYDPFNLYKKTIIED